MLREEECEGIWKSRREKKANIMCSLSYEKPRCVSVCVCGETKREHILYLGELGNGAKEEQDEHRIMICIMKMP